MLVRPSSVALAPVTKLGYSEEETKCLCDILMYSQLRQVVLFCLL